MSQDLKPPALEPGTVPKRVGSSYPPLYQGPLAGREKRALGDALGLTRYGVNLVTLPPGVWSAQRHWHSHEDEFVYVLDGELTLVTDQGEQALGAGSAAGFPAGVADGHHLVNRGDEPTTYLEVGDRRAEDEVHYPDIDLHLPSGAEGKVFIHKNGAPY